MDMTTFDQLFQTADWKKEKHVPIIECPDTVTAGELFDVRVTLGKEIAHPNTTEHHIRWISLHFLPADRKQSYELAMFTFSAHGESVKGPDQGPVHTHHEGSTKVKTTVGGTLYALAYCNIHGLWRNSKELTVL